MKFLKIIILLHYLKRINNEKKEYKMEPILYKTNMVFHIDFDYENKALKISNDLKPVDFIFVYSRYNNFMKTNPPCKNCLIRSMCIKENINEPAMEIFNPYLYIEICDRLKNFIHNNKLFYLQGTV